jgi:hypothetical protein
LEQKAAAALNASFGEAGWTLEPIKNDYGEDFLVRIFDSGIATPWTFFVQSKAMHDVRHVLVDSRRSLSIPVSVSHLRLWSLFAVPVFLTVFDGRTKSIYWEYVQGLADVRSSRSRRRTIRLRVPFDQLLSRESLLLLRHITKARHGRYEAQILAFERFRELIRRHWGVAVDVVNNPNVIIIPRGRFQPAPDGRDQVFLYDEVADIFTRGAAGRKLDPEKALEKIVLIGSRRLTRLDAKLRAGHIVPVQGPHGITRRRWKSLAELFAWEKRYGLLGLPSK